MGTIFRRGHERFFIVRIEDNYSYHNGRRIGTAAIGKLIDSDFIKSLPAEIDPNGENGEYHTFCCDGPIFRYPVVFHLGEAFSQSYDIRLDDGTVKTYSYCFANLK